MEAGNKDYYHLSPSRLPSPPSPVVASSSFLSQYTSLDSKISPSVLLIITILAVIFFLSGLVHLLIRYLFRPTTREPEESDNVTAFQGQLQQLFHLHDAGVDQSFIDALPVFLYKAITGVKDPFDCAVCLCEFEPEDKLRLLPKCSHAFHIECIDTWLLSHSTCPLCRASLLSDFAPATSCNPVVLVLESGSENSREIVPDHVLENSNVGLPQEEEILEKPGENVTKEELPTPPPPETKIVAVKLGKFRNLDPAGGVGGSSSASNNLDGRRCFSMGSFEYVMDEKSQLQVAIKPPEKKPGGNKPHRRRLAMSECDCHSQREGFRGFEPVNAGVIPPNPPAKKESFSFSKTWLRSKKDKPPPVDAMSSSSFQLQQEPKQSKEGSARMASELDSGSEFDVDVEVGSCNNGGALSRRDDTPSFSRRTLLWVIGRNQNHKNSSVCSLIGAALVNP